MEFLGDLRIVASRALISAAEVNVGTDSRCFLVVEIAAASAVSLFLLAILYCFCVCSVLNIPLISKSRYKDVEERKISDVVEQQILGTVFFYFSGSDIIFT